MLKLMRRHLDQQTSRPRGHYFPPHRAGLNYSPRVRISCSFCGKDESSVPHLVRGPKRIAICNECIAVCHDVNQNDRGFRGDVLLTDIGTLVTCDRFVSGILGEITDAAVAISGGVVTWAGPQRTLPHKYRDLPVLSCEGRVAVPGLVDAHAIGAGSDRTPPTNLWDRMAASGSTTLAASCETNTPNPLGLIDQTVADIGFLLRLEGLGAPDSPVRTIGTGAYLTDWVDLLDMGDAECVALSSRMDPRGYVAAGLSDDLSGALVEARRAVTLLPSHHRAHGNAKELWHTTVTALGSGGIESCAMNTDQWLSIWLAQLTYGMSHEMALWSATRGSALAMEWNERGTLVRGAVGDVVVLDTDSLEDLRDAPSSYHQWRVFKSGSLLAAA